MGRDEFSDLTHRVNFGDGSTFFESGLGVFPTFEPSRVALRFKLAAKFGDVGLHSSCGDSVRVLKEWVGAYVNYFWAEGGEPFADFFGSEPLSKVEDEVRLGISIIIEVFDLFCGGEIAGIGEDVCADGPSEPFGKLENRKKVICTREAPNQDEPF